MEGFLTVLLMVLFFDKEGSLIKLDTLNRSGVFNDNFSLKEIVFISLITEMYLFLSLPLDRSRRFARDVVDDAVDVGYFIHDAGTDGLQDLPRDASEVTRHAVDTRYGTDSNCVVVRSAVTHYSNAADAWKNREVLPYVAFKAVFGDFFA